METSEDEFVTPGAATVKEVEVRVSRATVSEHLSRERSTPPLPKARRSSKKPSRFLSLQVSSQSYTRSSIS